MVTSPPLHHGHGLGLGHGLGHGGLLEAHVASDVAILSDEECLRDRKWWCFLLSSIFTLVMGVTAVLVARGAASVLCCWRR